MSLTANSIRQLQDQHKDGYEPIVQIVEAKDSQTLRVKCLISDGKEACQCVINKDQNAPVKEFYCIRVLDSIPNRLAGRPTPLLTILRYVVVDTNQKAVIGTPTIQGAKSASPNQQSPPQQQQQQNQYNNNAPRQQQYRAGNPRSAPQEASINISDAMPISDLNPYSNKWVIKARVTSKGQLKEWKNKTTGKGGELFSVDLLDNHKGEIRATAYNSTAKKFYDLMQEGCVYYISNGKLKHANKKFSTLNNDYEITLEESSVVQPADSDDSIPVGNFNFCTIEEIQQKGANELVDITAIVDDPGNVENFRTKKGNETTKRLVKLVDGEGTTMRSIDLTLWGTHADSCNWQRGDCVCVKGVRTSDFHGVTLNSLFSSQFIVNSNELDTSIALQQWYNDLIQTGASVNLVQVSNQQSNQNKAYRPVNYLTDITKYELGVRPDGKPDFILVKGTVSFIKDTPLFYPACPNENCKGKKVEKDEYGNDGGQWSCSKCHQKYDSPTYRYIVSMKISDITGEQWVTAFNDSAGVIFSGCDANELEELKNTDMESFQHIIQEALFKQYTMKLRISEETRQDSSDGGPATRIKVQLSQAYPISYVSESKRLLNLISKVA